MKSVKEEIILVLTKIVKEMGQEGLIPRLDHPKEAFHGDYSTNLPLVLAKKLKQEPMIVAKNIAENARFAARRGKWKMENGRYLDRVEVAPPGFINFWLSKKYLIGQLQQIQSQELVELGEALRGKKIMVEYTDPNPFKEFHIGHLYSNAVGESICRLFEANGAQVWRANFFGDVGMHTAKSIYGILQKFKVQSSKFKNTEDLEKISLPERVKFLGEAYALGSKEFEEKDEAKEEVKRLNLLIFLAAQKYWEEEIGWKPRVNYRKHIKHIDETELSEIKKLWVTGRKWSLDYFEIIYKRLGTKFDGYYPESLTGEWGYDFVLEGLKKGIFEKSDGAIVYRGEKHGLHTRVFINKLGLPTYETKDIGNAPHKYSEFPYDTSLIVTAKEINEYFKVVIAAIKEVNPKLGEKTQHLGHGLVKLPEGKMSSRTGNIISGEWLLDEAKRRISTQFKDMSALVLEQVAVGAVKYALLKSGIGKDIEFDFETSVALEGNSGPYLQYTYARTQSIIKKCHSESSESETKNLGTQARSFANAQDDILNEEERNLLRLLVRFSEVVEEAATSYSPNHVCTYLFDLAEKFNLFYQKHKVIGSESEELRVALTSGVGIVLKNGLHVLGIEAPQRM